MKVRLAMLGGAAAALAIAGGSASAKSPAGSGPAATAASACTASLAIEGPFTGPVAQLGLEQLHFAQLAVAQENKAYGMHVSLAQDDTQLTPVDRDDQDAVDHRLERGRDDRTGRQPGSGGRWAAVRAGRDGIHLRFGDGDDAGLKRQPDVLPGRSQ